MKIYPKLDVGQYHSNKKGFTDMRNHVSRDSPGSRKKNWEKEIISERDG